MTKRRDLGKAAGLLTLCAALVLGLWAERRQTALSDRVVRLHVIAASDSAEDKEKKLRVRDAVWAACPDEPASLPLALPAVRAAAEAAAPCRVESRMWSPLSNRLNTAVSAASPEAKAKPAVPSSKSAISDSKSFRRSL